MIITRDPLPEFKTISRNNWLRIKQIFNLFCFIFLRFAVVCFTNESRIELFYPKLNDDPASRQHFILQFHRDTVSKISRHWKRKDYICKIEFGSIHLSKDSLTKLFYFKS